MERKKSVDILKGAILLEYRGRALYASVADSSADSAVKELFETLAAEEDMHVKVLRKQYEKVAGGEGFYDFEEAIADTGSADSTLSQKIVSRISAAGYEAAVISAALDFEKKAVEYYSLQADSADDPQEKKLYSWLANWEKTHMTMLAEMDDMLKEEIWYDSRFWPLD